MLLHRAGQRVTQMLVLPDSAALCIGYSNGDAYMWDTKQWKRISLTHANDTIRDIATTVDGRSVALAASDGAITVHIRRDNAWTKVWSGSIAHVRKLAITRDGILLALCADGSVWLLSILRQKWLYTSTGTVELTHVVLDESNSTAFVFDLNGRLVSIDLVAARALLDT